MKRPLRRAFMLGALAVTLWGQPVPAQTFGDVPTTHWAYSYIETFAAAGITGGCGNGNYCPDAPVTRAQMAVFLERAMRGSDYKPPAATGTQFLDIPATHWAGGYIEQVARDQITGGCARGNYCPKKRTKAASPIVGDSGLGSLIQRC